MIRTAIVGVAAASLFAGVAPAAQAQGLGSLGNIFKCEQSGSNQTGGAVIGGVLGGLAGAGVARNDALGAILGGALGAAAGSWIGCRLGGDDRASLEDATLRALNENRSTTWNNPRTGASARINVMADTAGGYGSGGGYTSYQPRYGEPMRYDQVRLAQRVSSASGYLTTAPRYTALNQTYIRLAPNSGAQTNGLVSRGEQVQAIARVQGQPWILVGRNGQGVGYVPETALQAASDTASGYGSGGYGSSGPISAQSIRLGSGVSWAAGYEAAPSMYSLRSNANLRASPSTQARTLGQLYRGDEIEAIAKVQGQPWILVGRNGQGIGYVNESVVTALGGGSQYASNPPGGGAGASDCRIVEQVITTQGAAAQTQRYRACRDASGAWNLATA